MQCLLSWPLDNNPLSNQVHARGFEVLRMNPEWLIACLTESKGTPLSAEVQQAIIDNSVDATTAKLLQLPSLEELGITSSLLQARVLAALQSLRPLSQGHVASAPSAPPFDDGIFRVDQPLPTAIANPGRGSGHVPDALFVGTGVPIVKATPVFESSAATAVVVTEEARGQVLGGKHNRGGCTRVHSRWHAGVDEVTSITKIK
jgi:hypothetical protein